MKQLILPPGVLIILFIVSLLLLKRNKKISSILHITTLCLFAILTMPVISKLLMTMVEKYPALTYSDIINSPAEVIVILGAGRNRNAKEYGGGHTLSRSTLERLRYGAYLHKITKLPILLSGEARFMKKVLTDEYHVSGLLLIEEKSTNTKTNAFFSKLVLEKNHLSKIILITNAMHMKRAVYSFEKNELTVTPAPTIFFGMGHESLKFLDFLPDIAAFKNSSVALHEMLGLLWYEM